MNQLTDGWPEITYRYIEHYFWEPQHLLRTESSIAEASARGESRVEAVYRRLRTQEAPLNYLLNVLLRIVPSSFRHRCLEPFGIELSDPGLTLLSLRTPRDLNYIQPDVHLESETARVFIEVKVDAPLTLKQIKKYVRLHAQLNSGYAKRSYVLFLAKRGSLKLNDVKQSFPHNRAGKGITALLEPDASGVTFGATTWMIFAWTLQTELDRRREEQGDSVEMLAVLVGDFLADLQSRGLLSTTAAIQQLDCPRRKALLE